MNNELYIKAFANYLRSGDLKIMQPYCVDASHIQRLTVYRNGFYKGCVDALAANFPMCEKLIGSNNFRTIARHYVDRFPPEQGTLVGYGLDFPTFINNCINNEAFGEAIDKGNDESIINLPPELPDIARLDYAWLMSLMSSNSENILTIDFVTQLIEQDIEFTELNVNLNPSVLLLRVSENAFQQWISLKTNNTDTGDTAAASDAFVMLWRLQGTVQARLLTAAEVALMQQLQSDKSLLGEAFDAAITVDENFEVSEAFTSCLQNELLTIQIN